jgi:hypothetical protein
MASAPANPGVADPVPLSFGQHALWFFEQLVPGTSVYNVPLAYRINGDLDVSALREALSAVVRRHEVLRTAFTAVRGTPAQVVLPAGNVPLVVVDRSAPGEGWTAALGVLGEHARTSLDIAAGQVISAKLVRVDHRDWLLGLVLHHIVTDGWSNRLLAEELTVAYQALLSGRPPDHELPALPVQFGDYAVWQREWLTDDVLADHYRFWETELAGLIPVRLPGQVVRKGRPAFVADRLVVSLGGELRTQVAAAARRARVSPFAHLAAAFCVTLSGQIGQTDLSFGTMLAGRTEPELELVIGYFVNMVVLRADLGADPCFAEIARTLNDRIRGAIDHEIPFSALVHRLAPTRVPGRNPLFEMTVQLLSGRAAPVTPGLPGAVVTPVEVYQGQHPFDLTVTFVYLDADLELHLEYSREVFDEGGIRDFADRLVSALRAGAGDSAVPASRLSSRGNR